MFYVILMSALLGLPAGGLVPPISAIRAADNAFQEQIYAIDDDESLSIATKRSRVRALYNDLLGQFLARGLGSLDDSELQELASAVSSASYMFSEAAHIEEQLKVVRELKHRRLEHQDHAKWAYLALVRQRQISAASAWLTEYPNLQMPAIRVSDPGQLEGQESGWRFYSTAVDGMAGLQLQRAAVDQIDVVVLSDPRCHFSRYAFTALQSDPAFQAFGPRVWWIGSQSEELWNWGRYQGWVKHGQSDRIGVAYSDEDWNFPLLPEMPAFYFYQDGVERYRFMGWPQEGNWTEWQRGLCAIGRALQPCTESVATEN